MRCASSLLLLLAVVGTDTIIATADTQKFYGEQGAYRLGGNLESKAMVALTSEPATPACFKLTWSQTPRIFYRPCCATPPPHTANAACTLWPPNACADPSHPTTFWVPVKQGLGKHPSAPPSQAAPSPGARKGCDCAARSRPQQPSSEPRHLTPAAPAEAAAAAVAALLQPPPLEGVQRQPPHWLGRRQRTRTRHCRPRLRPGRLRSRPRVRASPPGLVPCPVAVFGLNRSSHITLLVMHEPTRA